MKAPNPEHLLQTLVRIPSVNPGAGGGGEGGLITFLAELLDPWADSIELSEVAPDRGNLVARFDGKEGGRSYALEAHSDTVGVEGMTIDPFGGEVRDGRLWGRGACDTKGPMAAMLCALLGHLEKHGKPPATWYFVSTVDEELGGLGARSLVESGFRCNGIVVGEPTGLRPIVAHKGAVRYRVDVRGLAGHSAYPENGVNAIHALADWIHEMEAAIPNDPDGLTISVGTMRGGDQVNRIPDLATLEVDIRVPPGVAVAEVESLVDRVAEEVGGRRPGSRLGRERTQLYLPFRLAPESDFRRKLAPIFRGSEDRGETARYATNAGFFADAGIPSVVFGPGSIAQAHTADEWIDLASVEAAVDVFGKLIREP